MRLEQIWPFEKNVRTAEAALVWNKDFQTVGNTRVVMTDYDNDANFGAHIFGRRCS